MPGLTAPRPWVGRLCPRLLLFWAGLSIGVAFLATPAKFLAPSLSLPVALDVGRHTFRVYNQAEIVLLAVLAVMGLWSQRRRDWWLVLLLPALVLLVQGLWLLPALDARVSAIEAGATHLPPSSLHVIYIVVEAAKVLWLLAFGLAWPATSSRQAPMPVALDPRSPLLD